ncbi:hypothetical protein ASG03_14110 [Rhizobium sp. Leaf341]|nr:hypothetical protein ASG03_14110 [Rhizobium sp. Leaf341]
MLDDRHLGAMKPTNDETGTEFTMTADRAIISLLQELNIRPSTDISLFEIGPPLTRQGYDQDAILNGLFFLQRQKMIDLRGNRLHVLKELRHQTGH